MQKFITLTLVFFSISAYAQKKIIFLGDSLTEGYGVDKEQAYPHLIQLKLDKLSPDLYKVINGGVSGSTTASGLSRMRWFMKTKPYLVVLALGANDGLRGVKVAESKKNLETVIKMAQENNIKIILCEMHLPTNYGKEYRKSFNQMYKELTKKYKIGFIPFMLDGVGGVKELNLGDGIHPNVEGHKKVAENVFKYLEKSL